MPRLPRSVWILAGIVSTVVAVQAGAPAQRERRERGVVVTAWTQAGTPVTDMAEKDFIVREDDLAREVIRVSPAAPPSHIWLLVDDSQASDPAIAYLRTAIPKFIKKISALEPAPQLALMTFGDRPTKRVEFSSKHEMVEQGAGKLFAVLGSGAYFMMAVRDAATDLKKRNATNPIILAFVAEAGPEFSNDHRGMVRNALEQAGASLWTVVLESREKDLTTEGRERDAVIYDVSAQTGGLSRGAASPQGLDPVFESVGALISSRYLVVYGRPESTIPPKSVEVTTKRPNVRVSAARWLK
jgi:hypothetical protein